MAPVQDFGGPNQHNTYKKKQMQQQQQMQNPEILSIRIWREGELKPFRKNFYEPHVSVQNRPQLEIDGYRDANNIIVRGKDVPYPNYCFEEGCFPEYVVQVLLKQGFNEPTAIQSQGRFLFEDFGLVENNNIIVHCRCNHVKYLQDCNHIS